MKKHFYKLSLVLVLSAVIVSCDKTTSEPQQPVKQNEPENPSWNWTGTAPFSVKTDGKIFPVDTESMLAVEVMGYININARDIDNNLSFGLTIPASAEAGKEYAMPSPANITYTDYETGISYSAGTGMYKITKITTDEIEGYFYADLAAIQSTEPNIVLTEGYFQVAR